MNSYSSLNEQGRSLYQFFGIPEAYAITISILFFLVLLAPYFQGSTVFGRTFPVLTPRGRILAIIFGPVLFSTSMFAFYPRLIPTKADDPRAPFCWLGSTIKDDGSYRVKWLADAEQPALTEVGGVAVDEKGFLEYNWNRDNLFLTYNLTVRNRWGECTANETVWSPFEDWDGPLSCQIWSNKNEVSYGEDYLIYWWVRGSKTFSIKVNNKSVSRVGYSKHMFGQGTPDQFVIIAQSRDIACIDKFVVSRKSP